MKAIISADCRAGEFVVLFKDAGEPLAVDTTKGVTFPDYDAAEARARDVAPAKLHRRVFITQISGELVSVPHIVEVHRGA